MITVIPFESLGNANYGWLDAHYHFSFAHYHDPARMGFGALRVINDDIVAPKSGFDTHPHKDMEIITFVRSGAITHRDDAGNHGVTGAGDVQVMSAGSGIRHSEHNEGDEPTSLYQIWILPREKDIKPRWDARKFPQEPVKDILPLLVSGHPGHREEGTLVIHADACIYGGRLQKGTTINQPLKALGYLLVSEGSIILDGRMLKKGDGAQITNLKSLEITANDDSEVLLIDVAA